MNALEQAKHDRIVAEKDAEIARLRDALADAGIISNSTGIRRMVALPARTPVTVFSIRVWASATN